MRLVPCVVVCVRVCDCAELICCVHYDVLCCGVIGWLCVFRMCGLLYVCVFVCVCARLRARMHVLVNWCVCVVVCVIDCLSIFVWFVVCKCVYV